MTACSPVAQACSTWKPGILKPMQLATSGAVQNFQCQGIVEPITRYSRRRWATPRRPRIRLMLSPANWPMLTSARGEVCHAGKKLLPHVPYGILARGNFEMSAVIGSPLSVDSQFFIPDRPLLALHRRVGGGIEN